MCFRAELINLVVDSQRIKSLTLLIIESFSYKIKAERSIQLLNCEAFLRICVLYLSELIVTFEVVTLTLGKKMAFYSI